MIGLIRGKIIEKKPPQLLIDVGGVGYEVQASMNTFYQLPKEGAEVSLHTHFVVREDAQLLYGFYEASERALFRTLIKVNGVGPKLGLTILSSIDPDSFVACVNDNDSMSLVRLPGIGKKTAERLIVEMRDKLSDWQTSAGADVNGGSKAPLIVRKRPSDEAVSALVALGYKPQEASRAISQIDDEGLTCEELIRDALRRMVQKTA